MVIVPPHILGASVAERRAKLPLYGAKSRHELHDLAHAQALALAIVETLPEPFLVLDNSLRLLAGSRCFYQVYGEDPVNAHGRSILTVCAAIELSPRGDFDPI